MTCRRSLPHLHTALLGNSGIINSFCVTQFWSLHQNILWQAKKKTNHLIWWTKRLSLLGKHGRAVSSCASPLRITTNPPPVMTLHCLHAQLGSRPASRHGNCIKKEKNGHGDFQKSSVLSRSFDKSRYFFRSVVGADGRVQDFCSFTCHKHFPQVFVRVSTVLCWLSVLFCHYFHVINSYST